MILDKDWHNGTRGCEFRPNVLRRVRSCKNKVSSANPPQDDKLPAAAGKMHQAAGQQNSTTGKIGASRTAAAQFRHRQEQIGKT